MLTDKTELGNMAITTLGEQKEHLLSTFCILEWFELGVEVEGTVGAQQETQGLAWALLPVLIERW